MIMANPFVHVELGTTDVAKAKSFYQALFAWKLDDVDMGGGATYTTIGVGEGTGGGMMKHPVAGAPSSWLPYVLVDDIKASTAKAKSLGATVKRDVTEVMGMGWLSIIADPTGATLGLWQAKTK
jgi:predicted enzyme related to lactoylglutathione lyase